MSDYNDLSTEELQQLLYERRRQERRQRWQRLKESGRVVEVAGAPPPLHSTTTTPPLQVTFPNNANEDAPNTDEETANDPVTQSRWRWLANKALLLVEITAVVGLVAVLGNLWFTGQELNQELAQIQRAEAQSLALPTPSPTPVIGVAILPSGHKPPIDGRPPEQGEAGDIPAHLLPQLAAYQPPPQPTPGPEQARRIQIPSINVDSTIVQGDDWDQLKKGVGQHIGSTQPGQEGNLVLSAHNDIYGEIFRYLDRLSRGDEIIISTERSTYTYVIRDFEVVEPTDVWVMNPTEHASTTLISCYPYRVNTHRYIIFADLVTQT